jgi:hypothetical protein
MPVSSTSVWSPVSRATQFTQPPFIPRMGPYNNCKNTLCYTANHNNVYQKNTAYGMVGTSAAGYLARRKRL